MDPFHNPNVPSVSRFNDDFQTKQKERFDIVILDSADRSTSKYPSINDFMVELAAPLRNVQGVRLLKSEWLDYASNSSSSTYGTTTANFVVGNSVTSISQGGTSGLPLSSPTSSVFVSINNYSLVKLANKMESPIFARLSSSSETYPLGVNFMSDPATYVINPVDTALSRFEVKVLNGDGSLIAVSATARIILTLGVSCVG